MTDSNNIDRLKAFLEEDPSDAFSRYALALEQAKSGQMTEAIRSLEYLKDKQKDYLALYYQLGKFHESLGNIPKAVTNYKEGIKFATLQQNRHTLNELKQALSEISDAEDDV
ncbi:hypothetical protein BH11BAC2_BH11BAC2_16290 [soil metagenome]